MKNVNTILLLLILFPIDFDEFMKFMEIKAQKIIEGKHLLNRILSPMQYSQLLEGSYFLLSSLYLQQRTKLKNDKEALAAYLTIEKNIPFLIYCLRRYSYSVGHPTFKFFINEVSALHKNNCDA